MKKLVILLILLLPLALLAGCDTPRTRLLSMQNTVYGNPPLQNIERSIVLGASNAGWAVEPDQNNVVHAAYRFSSEARKVLDENPREPVPGRENDPKTVLEWLFAAKNNGSTDFIRTTERIVYVTISYSGTSYRIDYANSVNMGFDADSDSIFNTYNEVVKKLDRSIQAELISAY